MTRRREHDKLISQNREMPTGNAVKLEPPPGSRRRLPRRQMRVVVVTNVVVSAILRDRLPEQVILFIIARPDFEWAASQEILTAHRVFRGLVSRFTWFKR